jgi:hypothetical protein
MKDNVLKLFGSLCYKHISDAKRRNLGDKSEPMILVGYHETGAYRLYHPLNHLIVISRDVKICVNQAWDWNNKEKSSNHTVPTIIEEDDQVEQVQLDTEVQAELLMRIKPLELQSGKDLFPQDWLHMKLLLMIKLMKKGNLFALHY